jgi:hypothetical protein
MERSIQVVVEDEIVSLEEISRENDHERLGTRLVTHFFRQ